MKSVILETASAESTGVRGGSHMSRQFAGIANYDIWNPKTCLETCFVLQVEMNNIYNRGMWENLGEVFFPRSQRQTVLTKSRAPKKEPPKASGKARKRASARTKH